MAMSDYHVVGDPSLARPVPPTPASDIGYDNTSSGMSATDVQEAIDELASGSGGGAVTGVKGNSESTYRTGNVNITKANIGLGNVPNVTTDNQTPTVSEAISRVNLASGDTLVTIVGKIKKFFSDLKTVAFTGSYSDLTGQPTIPTKTSDLTNDSGFVTTDTTYEADGKFLKLSDGVFTKQIFPGSQQSSTYWYKICECSITTRYAYWGFDIEIRGEARADAESPYIRLICRGKQQNAMTSDCFYKLKAIAWSGYSPTNCRLYVTSNTSSLKKVELWVYNPTTYQELRTVINDHTGSGTINWTWTRATNPPDYSYASCIAEGYVKYADIAEKLGTSTVGSATQPIYLNGGTPTACTYTEVVLTSGIVLRKQSSIVNVQCVGVTAATLITKSIPEGYRPTRTLWFNAFMITGGNTYTAIVCFNSNGTITASFYNPGGPQNAITSAYTSHTLYFNSDYII